MNIILLKLIEALIGIIGRMIIEGIRKFSERRTQDRLVAIAIPHVKALMNSALGDTERKAAAFDAIKADCKKLGLEAKDWLVNITIEAIVGDLKEKPA